MSTTDAEALTWDLSDLLDGGGEEAVDGFLDDADRRADRLAERRGTIGSLSGADFTAVVQEVAAVHELLERAGSYAYLRFAADTTDPANGARMQHVQERSTAVST